MFWGAVKVCPWWLHYKTHTDAHTDLHTRTPLSVTHAFPQSTEYISMRLGVVCVGHNYNKWFFWEAAEQWRWGVNVRGRPLGQRWCLELENECGDWQADHMHAHTDTPRAQDWGFWSHRQLFFFFSPPLSLMLAQTNQCTCVLTPKSQSLTRPRVFTSILEGLTSVETNCFIELQHQHTAACLYQPCSFLITRRPCTTLLTSVKYLQAPQIRQAFDYLETQATENNYQFWQHEACNQHTLVNNNYFTLTQVYRHLCFERVQL